MWATPAARRRVGAIRALATAQLDHLPDGRPHSRPPALLLFPDAAPPIAVEVQLSVEGSRRLEAICRGWARCPIDSEVGYYAVPQVQRAASRAVSGACAEDVIRGSR